MVNSVNLSVDYSIKQIPRARIDYMAKEVQVWDVTHIREYPHDELAYVPFSFMKTMKAGMTWGKSRKLFQDNGFHSTLIAEQEALRKAPASVFAGVIEMINSCPIVKDSFPNGVSSFSIASLSTSVMSEDGVEQFPFVQVDMDNNIRGYQLLPVNNDAPVPSLVVFSLVRSGSVVL